jgi:hypothetical protein
MVSLAENMLAPNGRLSEARDWREMNIHPAPARTKSPSFSSPQLLLHLITERPDLIVGELPLGDYKDLITRRRELPDRIGIGIPGVEDDYLLLFK